MPNYSISADGFILILIFYAVLLFTTQTVESLQAARLSFVNNTGTNTTILSNMNLQAADLIDKGDYEQALQLLDETITIEPNFTAGITNKGLVLSFLGQYGEAIELFDKAIGIDPNDTDAIGNKGNALSDLGQYRRSYRVV